MVKAILLALSLAAGILFGLAPNKPVAHPATFGPGVPPPPTCPFDDGNCKPK